MGKKRIGIDKSSGKAIWKLDVDVRGGSRKRERFIGSYEEANKRILEIKEEIRIRASRENAQSRMQVKTFGEALKAYTSTKGYQGCEGFFNNLLKYLGNSPFTRLKETFQAFIDNFLIPFDGENSTKLKYVAYANAIVEFAMSRDENILINPINRLVRKFKSDYPATKRNRILTPLEYERFMEKIKFHRPYLYPITEFALMVPSRKDELVSLQKTQIDSIDSKEFGKVYFIVLQDKDCKSGQPNWKIIPRCFNAYIESIPENCPWVFYRPKFSNYTKVAMDNLKTYNGEWAPLGDFKKAWLYCLKEAKISDFHFHDTRHHSATRLSQFGASTMAVRNQANWEDLNMASRYHKLTQHGMLQELIPVYEKMTKNILF